MSFRLVDNKDKIIAQMKVEVARRLNNTAQYAVDQMRDLCPVDTGALKSTIRQDHTAVPDNLTAIVRAGTPEINYGAYINYGTHKMPAQPFFTVAMLLTRQAFPQFMYGRTK